MILCLSWRTEEKSGVVSGIVQKVVSEGSGKALSMISFYVKNGNGKESVFSFMGVTHDIHFRAGDTVKVYWDKKSVFKFPTKCDVLERAEKPQNYPAIEYRKSSYLVDCFRAGILMSHQD